MFTFKVLLRRSVVFPERLSQQWINRELSIGPPGTVSTGGIFILVSKKSTLKVLVLDAINEEPSGSLWTVYRVLASNKGAQELYSFLPDAIHKVLIQLDKEGYISYSPIWKRYEKIEI